MNITTKYSLSFKYAVAFSRVYSEKIYAHFYFIDNAIFLIKSKKNFFSKQIVPTIQEKYNHLLIKEFLQYLNLPDYFFSLAILLLKQNRFFLFLSILEQIKNIILKQLNKEEISIYSTHILSKDEIEKIEKFIYLKKEKTVLKTTCFISPNLIAGIRIVGNNFIFDCSIQKQLTRLNAVLKQERIST